MRGVGYDLFVTDSALLHRYEISSAAEPLIMRGKLADLQCGHADKVLLLDETQSSYYGVIFWNTLLKQASGGTGIHVLLFSSYGAPMDYPVVKGFVTPMILGPSQIIGLTWESDKLTGAAGLLTTSRWRG
jgi:hypothetical protein